MRRICKTENEPEYPALILSVLSRKADNRCTDFTTGRRREVPIALWSGHEKRRDLNYQYTESSLLPGKYISKP